MTAIPASSEPIEQVFDQIQRESGHEDLTGLSQEDLKSLARQQWDWAATVDAGTQDVRVLLEAEGADGNSLSRTILETVSPDMPFLVDSVLGECGAQGFEVAALFHPIVKLQDGRSVSIIQVHLPVLTHVEADRLKQGVRKALAHNAVAVADFEPMRARMQQEITRLEGVNHLKDMDRDEAVAFLKWLSREHFVFLGCREYDFETDADGHVLPEEPIMVDGSNLGVLRDEELNVLSREAEPLILTPEIGAHLSEPYPILVAKSTLVSLVHRRVACDYVGVKKYDAEGRVNGEVRFLGLFTAEAYDETARSIPLIRRRIAAILEAAGATPGGHTEKALTNLLETWPRDELFQTSSKILHPIIVGALHLIGRPRTRLFVRQDQFDRFVTAIVYVPREAYDTAMRQRITQELVSAYKGRVTRFRPYFDSETLVRVHFEIWLDQGHPLPDLDMLEKRIVEIARTWEQGFRAALVKSDLERTHQENARAFIGAFNAAYREAFGPDEAMRDVAAMANLSAAHPILARAYRMERDGGDKIRVKIYSRSGSIPLSACVPIFERMGFFVDFETGFPVRPTERPAEDAPETYWIHDVVMCTSNGAYIDLNTIRKTLEDAFVAVWGGRAENDGFNKLVLSAGASWRDAALIRALAGYRRQSGMEQPQYVQETALSAYPGIARQLLDLFATRFDPAREMSLAERKHAAEKVRADIEDSLRDVSALADDQVLRRLADLILAVQRTNFYQTNSDGDPYSFVSLKIASRELEDLPEPKPFREIYMSSPQVEGVHLRFGAVARGGLRWSDRASDYRTEVLGLVKAQQVKNAVIVPVGSKGGFLPKQLPDRSDRNAWFEAGRDAYKQFIRALLGITDNLVEGEVSHPADTVVWDGEDPYLVVAADKGTATFSDTANAISEEMGHWLGDAFASGGSAGYDHKRMGITARGGWEAVKRHFRELGTDIQSEPFSVIGVGDMSGDVFGNGMLLSPEIRLVAAFNHMHIFIDPDPVDAGKNLAERQRLFDKPQSSWADYNKGILSEGGGIFDRSAKSITLNDQIKALTGLSKDAVTPDELIHALLKTPADLLWFGGIGTYVKAAHESHAMAGDRANDAIRVNADDLKVKVIGEGANLGVTQAGRIEFALRGGHINTDAIDNSAGVDSSDHEVNIKILAAEAIREGDLQAEQRNELLADMTDEVAALVLRHNYTQTFALTLAEATAKEDHDALERLMEYLEDRGVLNRALETLPETGEMKVRAEREQPLTRPELAVLLAWSKITLFDDIVASDIPDDPYFNDLLTNYFPSPINTYTKAMSNHRLKREIIATIIANRMLDMAGPVALLRLREVTGSDNAQVARGLEAARAVLNFDGFQREVDQLDNIVPADVQTDLRLHAASAMVDAALWFIETHPDLRVGEAVQRTEAPLNEFKAALSHIHSPFPAARIEREARGLMKRGVSEELSRWASAMGQFAQGLLVVDLAGKMQVDVPEAGKAFYLVGDQLRIDRLRAMARDNLLHADYWDRVAGRRLLNELVRMQADATEKALSENGAQAWLDERDGARRALLEELHTLGKDRNWAFARFVLAVDALRQFMRH